MRVKPQTIRIPHLNYTVRIRLARKGDGIDAADRAWCERDGKFKSTICTCDCAIRRGLSCICPP